MADVETIIPHFLQVSIELLKLGFGQYCYCVAEHAEVCKQPSPGVQLDQVLTKAQMCYIARFCSCVLGVCMASTKNVNIPSICHCSYAEAISLQAVERVRITVQLRRLANSSSKPEHQLPPPASKATHVSPEDARHSSSGSLRSTSSMSLESMRSVMSNLRSTQRPSMSSSRSDADSAA